MNGCILQIDNIALKRSNSNELLILRVTCNKHLSNLARYCSSSRKLLILFVLITAAVTVLWLGGIVSVICSIVLSKDSKPFMRDLSRAATSPKLRKKMPGLTKGDNICSFPFAGSGAVDFEEFCLLMEKKIAQETQSEILDLFRIWDLSGEGIIESGELRCLLNRIPERLTRKEIDLLVKQADTKKNGKINFEGESLLFYIGCVHWCFIGCQ